MEKGENMLRDSDAQLHGDALWALRMLTEQPTLLAAFLSLPCALHVFIIYCKLC